MGAVSTIVPGGADTGVVMVVAAEVPADRRPLLRVALHPFTAAWLAERLRDEFWTMPIAEYEAAGRPGQAGALRRDRLQLLEAQRQWRERQEAAPVAVAGAPVPPADEAPPPPPPVEPDGVVVLWRERRS